MVHPVPTHSRAIVSVALTSQVVGRSRARIVGTGYTSMALSVSPSDFIAFITFTALFVITPGAATAVVIRNSLNAGRGAGLLTAGGITFANAVYATAAAFGLSAVVVRAPSALQAIRVIGALYLAFLGCHSLWQGLSSSSETGVQPALGRSTSVDATAPLSVSTWLGQGMLTNFLNPSTIMFYAAFVPQFIRPGTEFRRTFLVIAVIHLLMAFSVYGTYAITIGRFGQALTRPRPRAIVRVVTGVALVALAIQIVSKI